MRPSRAAALPSEILLMKMPDNSSEKRNAYKLQMKAITIDNSVILKYDQNTLLFDIFIENSMEYILGL